MSNSHGASGANGHNGHANGTGALLERPSTGELGLLSMGNGTLLELGAPVAAARTRSVAKRGTSRRLRVNAAGEPLPPLPRNPFNAAQQSELEITEKVCLAALRVEYAPALLLWDVTEAEVKALLADVRAARLAGSAAQASTNARMQATREESDAKAQLVGAFRTIQSAARRVFGTARPAHLRDYGVGVLMNSRTAITQVYEGILEQLQSDVLPGITPEKIADFSASYNNWKSVIAAQGDSQSGATGLRAQRNTSVVDVSVRRREIQSAANGIWPPLPQNHGTRREFALDPTRNYSGATKKARRRAKS